MKNLYLIIPAFLFMAHFNAYAQCESCDPRSVALYDIKVVVDPPPAGANNDINTFIKLLEITGHALAYFVVEDPLAYCNKISNVVSAYPADTLNYADIAGMQTEPINTSGHDYYIWGTVSGSSGSYTAEAKMAVGKTQEIIKSTTVSFGDDFDPQAIAYQLGAGIGSTYSTIQEFEKEKRDGGEPYAITPTIIMKPEKNKVDFNESTPVYITAKDCDGEPLKNRPLHLTVDGGTLDTEDVTTDDQGTSFVMFTAGTESKIAIVHTEYNYTTPPENSRTCSAEPAVIQIQKPEDAWYVQGSYKTTSQGTSHEDGSIPGVQSYVQTSDYNSTSNVFYAAWVKRQPIPYHPLEFATTTADPIDIKYRAIETTYADGTVSWASSCCNIIDQSHSNSSTKHIAGGDNKLYIAIGNYAYGFSFTLIDSHRNGQEFSMEDKYDPIEGHTHTESTNIMDDDTHQGVNVQDANWDTTYTDFEFDPSAGETATTMVSQTFSWDNERCKLIYSSDHTVIQDVNLFGVQTKSVTRVSKNVTFWMSYNGEAPSAVDEGNILPDGVLYQNSPNPCSSVTRISYSIGSSQHVALKIFDVYGTLVDVLADEVKSPGLHTIAYDVSGLPAGAYFCHLESGNAVQLRKIIVVK